MLTQHSVSRLRLLGLVVAIAAGLSLVSPSVGAQSSPLTVQPSNGRVGIGTTAPAGKLHVAESFFTSAGRVGILPETYGARLDFFGAGADRYLSLDNAAGGLRLITQDTSGESVKLYFNNAGSMGIGTMSPAAKLDILTDVPWNQGIRMVSSSIYGSGMYLVNSDTGGRGFALISTGSGVGVGAGDLLLWNNNQGTFPLFVSGSNGNIGIGTLTPTSLLHVAGTFTATSKNFQIPHPLEPERKLLTHSSLEGPEVGVYYRGEAELSNGETVIFLPDYFEALTLKEQRTVQLTPIQGWSPLYVAEEVKDGHFKVRAARGGDPRQRFYWEVKAVRADVAPLAVESLAENLKVVKRPQSQD